MNDNKQLTGEIGRTNSSMIAHNSEAVGVDRREILDGEAWSTMTPIPWMPKVRLSTLPNGSEYQLETDLATIIYTPERAENIQIQASVVIGGSAGHDAGTLTKIFHNAISWAYKRNSTVRLENPQQGATCWSPRVTARIDAESVREVFSKAYDLAMEMLLAVTDIAKSQVTTYRRANG